MGYGVLSGYGQGWAWGKDHKTGNGPPSAKEDLHKLVRDGLVGKSPAEQAQFLSHLRSTASLHAALGNSAYGDQINKLADHYAAQYGVGAAPGTDYGSGEFGLTGAEGTFDAANAYNESARGKPLNRTAYNQRLQQLLAERQQTADQQFYDTQIDPALSSAETTASGLASTPEYGNDAIAGMKSDAGAAITGAKESQLLGLGSLFGMNGLTANSPAMTAIGERASQEAQNQLQGALRDINMRTTEANRESAGNAASLTAQLATTRLSARSGVQSGDRQMVTNAANSLNSTQEALRQEQVARAQQKEIQDQAVAAQRRANYIRYGTAAAGIAATIATGGAAAPLAAGALAQTKSATSPYSGTGAGYGDGETNFLTSARQAGYGG